MICSACGQDQQEQGKPCSSCGVVFSLFEATGVIPLEENDTTETALTAIASVGSLAVDAAALVVRKGPLEGVRFDLVARDGQLVTVGRSPESSIFLDDVTVSRKHASITKVGADWQITDAGSLNGTYVNKSRVETSLLRNNDELQIGKYRFSFLSGAN
jgi:pSer/pThr/pTyr-binding forkhead associated (FHA) protein